MKDMFGTYINFSVENNKRNPNTEVADHIETSKYKREVFVIKKF